MNQLIFQPQKQITIKIEGENKEFPVRRVYCIGMNYADHVIEMGNDPEKGNPVFFQKNTDNVNTSGFLPYPPETNDVHHETELVIALKSGDYNISKTEAYNHIYGFAIGLDMTRRDLQWKAKENGKPWEIGKAFEHSAPIGMITPIEKSGKMEEGSISLKVNDKIKQKGNLNMMIWKIPNIIEHLSKFNKLHAGDLIMTGTPSGVGAVKKGDKLEANIDNLQKLELLVE